MISNALLTLFVFLCGFETLLPVHDGEIGAVRASDLLIAGGLSLKEAILLLHAALNLRNFGLLVTRPQPPGFVMSCFLFCGLGLVSSLINGHLQDIPQALRFLLAAYYAQAFCVYARTNGVEMPLRVLLAGMVGGGGINLYYTFVSSRAFLGFLPLLWGQNGPGGYAGLMVGMSLPLSRLASHATHRMLSVAVVLGSVFITLISYSKLGMLMSGLGVMAWGVHWLSNRSKQLLVRVAVMLLAFLAVAAWKPAMLVEQFAVIYEYKFDDSFDDSDMARLSYYFASAEVASSYPLGVSFTGIGRAFEETTPGRQGRLPEEEDVRNVNPHNSFLAFLAANGFLSLFPAAGMFAFWVVSIRRALVASVVDSRVVWLLLVSSCVLFANTLPGFFEVFFLHSIVLMLYAGSRKLPKLEAA